MLVLGLDGVPVGLVRRLVEGGVMPNLGSLVAGGTLARMESELPSVSSVAWASFATGCRPDRHGIFGFTDLRAGSYEPYFPSAADLRAPTLWDRAAMEGRRSLVVNLPGTYPARRLRGAMVAGFVAPDLGRACYPPKLAGRLAASGYRIDVEARHMPADPGAFVADLEETLVARRRAILDLVATERWDLAIAVVTETDRLHHFFYAAWERGEPEAVALFERVYRAIDDLVGELLERVPPATRVLAASDHGFTTARRHVHVNALLAEHGWLKASSLAGIDRSTKAFALESGRVYLNASERFPNASLSLRDGEARELEDKIAAALLSLTDPEDGQPVVERVLRRRDVYRGAQRRRAPQLLVVPRPGYELKGAIGRPLLTPPGPFEGTHTYHDAFLALDQPFGADGAVPTIVDATATAAGLLGVDAGELDGRPLR